MSFRRTFVRNALERNDIHPALKKLWKKHYAIDGQVTQHLSPFEQNIVTPMFKDAWKKIYDKLVSVAWECGPGLGTGLAIYYWGNYEYARRAYEHRD